MWKNVGILKALGPSAEKHPEPILGSGPSGLGTIPNFKCVSKKVSHHRVNPGFKYLVLKLKAPAYGDVANITTILFSNLWSQPCVINSHQGSENFLYGGWGYIRIEEEPRWISHRSI